MSKNLFCGINAHRLTDNPREQIAADLWHEYHGRVHGIGLLPYLLGGPEHNMHPPTPDDHDYVIAATLMQWLGTSVGQNYICELQTRWNAAES